MSIVFVIQTHGVLRNKVPLGLLRRIGLKTIDKRYYYNTYYVYA